MKELQNEIYRLMFCGHFSLIEMEDAQIMVKSYFDELKLMPEFAECDDKEDFCMFVESFLFN